MAAKSNTKTTTKRPSRRPTSTTAENVTTQGPTTDEIKARAFQLFLARGGKHGHHVDDWLRAERELRERYSVS